MIGSIEGEAFVRRALLEKSTVITKRSNTGFSSLTTLSRGPKTTGNLSRVVRRTPLTRSGLPER